MIHFIASDWRTYEEMMERIEKAPRYNHLGEKITNPFSYAARVALERIAWLLPEPDLKGTEVFTIKISFEYHDAWVRAIAEMEEE